MERKEETDIINRILPGEINLFSRFVDDYGTSVFRMVRQIVTCHEEAEEIVQDIFMKAFTKLSSFKGDARFSTWIFRIAYNTAISAKRKKRNESYFDDEKTLDNIPDEEIGDFFDDDTDEQMILKLQEAIKQLPPDEKMLITLFYIEGKSVDEMGAIANLSTSNVKVKLFRIRKKLYLQLNDSMCQHYQ